MSIELVNPLNANPTKWSNTLKQFVDFWVCLTILCGWYLKGLIDVLDRCYKKIIENLN